MVIAPHRIRRLTATIAVADLEAALRLRARAEDLVWTLAPRVIERVFDAVAPAGVHLRLDRLDLDLGVVPAERMERDALNALERALTRALLAALGSARDGSSADHADLKSPESARLEDLETFLASGLGRRHAPGEAFDPEAVLADLSARAPEAIAAMIRRLTPHPEAMERLVVQAGEPAMAALVRALAPTDADADAALACAADLTRASGGDVAWMLSDPAARRALWRSLLTWLSRGSGGGFDRTAFLAELLNGADSGPLTMAALAVQATPTAARASGPWPSDGSRAPPPAPRPAAASSPATGAGTARTDQAPRPAGASGATEALDTARSLTGAPGRRGDRAGDTRPSFLREAWRPREAVGGPAARSDAEPAPSPALVGEAARSAAGTGMDPRDGARADTGGEADAPTPDLLDLARRDPAGLAERPRAMGLATRGQALEQARRWLDHLTPEAVLDALVPGLTSQALAWARSVEAGPASEAWTPWERVIAAALMGEPIPKADAPPGLGDRFDRLARIAQALDHGVATASETDAPTMDALLTDLALRPWAELWMVFADADPARIEERLSRAIASLPRGQGERLLERLASMAEVPPHVAAAGVKTPGSGVTGLGATPLPTGNGVDPSGDDDVDGHGDGDVDGHGDRVDGDRRGHGQGQGQGTAPAPTPTPKQGPRPGTGAGPEPGPGIGSTRSAKAPEAFGAPPQRVPIPAAAPDDARRAAIQAVATALAGLAPDDVPHRGAPSADLGSGADAGGSPRPRPSSARHPGTDSGTARDPTVPDQEHRPGARPGDPAAERAAALAWLAGTGPDRPIGAALARRIAAWADGEDEALDAALRRGGGEASVRTRWAEALPDAVLARLLQRLAPARADRLVTMMTLLAAAARRTPGSGAGAAGLPWALALGLVATPRRHDWTGLAAGLARGLAGASGASGAAALLDRASRLARSAGHTEVLAALRAAGRLTAPPPGTAATDAPRWAHARQPPAPPAVGETIYVANAGLVLFNPYLPALFDRLGLLDDGDDGARKVRGLEATSRGVHLLQYLVDGRLDQAEPDLALNKALCGLVPAAPVLPRLEPAAADLALCDSLLEAVIAAWPILRGNSAAALRETFLRREGRLTREPGRWALRVQRRTVDVLVDQIPWAISVVYHRWMTDPIHVTW